MSGNCATLSSVFALCITWNRSFLSSYLERYGGEAPPQSEVPFTYEIPPEGIVLDDVVGQVEKDLVEKAIRLLEEMLRRRLEF